MLMFISTAMLIFGLVKNKIPDLTSYIIDTMPMSAIYAFVAFICVFLIVQTILISICVCSLLYSIENNKKLTGGV